ncbi:kinase-like protein, partial [Nadsonia fulvescens var. elongata DSM 6958]
MFYQYKLGRTLGEGQFGRVKEGWTGETKVAIKLLLKKKLLQDDTAESRLREEVECLERISHPNIIKIIEVLNDDTYVGIVTECMPNGDLFRYVNESSSGQPSENQARIWFSQLISAVSYLHDNGIAHRDIKLDNLLLDSKMNLVVADFGFAHSFNDNGNIRHPTATSGCGSPCYAAPEVVVPEPNYSARMADIWSCGVVLYCLLTGMLPWDDYKIRIANEDIFYDFIIRASLSFPEFINESACNLIQNILCIDPDTRFTMKDIKSHPWTRGRNMDVTQYL